ncbi:MAG: SDR family oxidoreductase [Acidimicrobiia bacterium]|nr:SDR family NAD(P)-dependent oxidoreductase [bacterium]MXZ05919.1 SDR family oxidoreductase [Acidimicrobiia bacterium]MYF25886.1 SDR family oxidoreductase [Acidimicrobiia bacterium]
MGVRGRVAIVTGGAGGIGFGIADHLAESGARVAIFDRDPEGTAKAAQRLTETHGSGSATSAVVDLTDRADVGRAVSNLKEAFGSIDIVVNNAGVITPPTAIEELSERDWDWVMNTNIRSQYLLCGAVVPHMKAAGFGRIINIASRSWLGGTGLSNYAASKGAVVAFTRSLAIELGPAGITANCVSPTLVVTPLFLNTPESDQAAVMARVARQPIARPGTPRDIAQAVKFFADENSSYITGQHLYVGGGGDLVYSTP